MAARYGMVELWGEDEPEVAFFESLAELAAALRNIAGVRRIAVQRGKLIWDDHPRATRPCLTFIVKPTQDLPGREVTCLVQHESPMELGRAVEQAPLGRAA
jgi:hypothetical protein